MQRSTAPIAVLILLLGVGVTACQQTTDSTQPKPNRIAEADAATASGNEATPMPEKQGSRQKPVFKMAVEKSPFGKLEDGREVTLYTFSNERGTTVKMMDYGATIVSVETYDREGRRGRINLGFDDLKGYLQRHPYFGSTVGRFCNRIAGGKFALDGKQYKLATNNGPNHLHGGDKGLDRVLWKAGTVTKVDSAGVTFIYDSPDGEEGYPGNLRVSASYILSNDNEFAITLAATTDKSTPVNLTNHCYWNLGGAGSGTILDEELMINADQLLPVDETLIPTGELAGVAGTPFDFRTPHKIGARIDQLTNKPRGYDHCYVLSPGKEAMRLVAQVRDPKSGRVMEIHTTQPSVQFYSGNFLDGTPASGGFPQYSAFCLETEHFPDSPNRPAFPTTILRPGETFRQVTIHKFRVE